MLRHCHHNWRSKTARRCQSNLAVAAAAAERRRRYLQAVIALVHTADDAAVEHISTGEWKSVWQLSWFSL